VNARSFQCAFFSHTATTATVSTTVTSINHHHHCRLQLVNHRCDSPVTFATIVLAPLCITACTQGNVAENIMQSSSHSSVCHSDNNIVQCMQASIRGEERHADALAAGAHAPLPKSTGMGRAGAHRPTVSEEDEPCCSSQTQPSTLKEAARLPPWCLWPQTLPTPWPCTQRLRACPASCSWCLFEPWSPC
jgi:hypothetical protein